MKREREEVAAREHKAAKPQPRRLRHELHELTRIFYRKQSKRRVRKMEAEKWEGHNSNRKGENVAKSWRAK
jgi:hypothetical protein